MRTIAVIPSGGSGKRSNSPVPKQYLTFKGKEMLAYTLEVFQKCPLVDDIVVAAQQEYFNLIDSIAQKYGISKLKELVEGGKERQDSVYNALNSLQCADDDIIAVHDAARPLLDEQILVNSIHTAETYGCALVCLTGRDTLLKGDDFVESYIDRDKIHYAQTPQVFKYHIIKQAMDLAYSQNFYGTDESMLVKRAAHQIMIVEGSILNFKVTTESDLKIFEKLIRVI